jgi:hypothetical protein
MSQIELNNNILDEEEPISKIEDVEDIERQMERRLSSLKKTKKIHFWSNDPNILFQQKYVTEFFPMDSMTFEQKLNAVSRTVIVLGLLSFVYSRKVQIIGITALSLFLIFLMYYFYKQKDEKKVRFQDKEGFTTDPSLVFDKPTPKNPLDNVLLPDYDYNANKKPAPPVYVEKARDAVLANAKQLVQEANPDQPGIADKLFNSLGEELQFEQSMGRFYSNPSTTIPNDQGAFADFCYGSMVSCKEGNMFACARNDGARYNNY